jgi:Domain of unknown function (DUF4411)
LKDVNQLVAVKREPHIAEPTEEVLLAMKAILKTHGRLVDNKKHRSVADPWVIAHAQVEGAIVVTEEQESNGKSPKIPDVCSALGILCIRTVELFRAFKLVAQ